MVNAGVSFSLDRTNHVSNSRTAMAREILDLRAEVTELKAMVAKGGLGSIAEDKMKIFRMLLKTTGHMNTLASWQLQASSKAILMANSPVTA